MCDDFDSDGDPNESDSDGEDAQLGEPPSRPSPGERLLYALGQLYRQHRSGELP